MPLTNIKLTLTADRKLLSVECDDFRVKLNGNTNDVYKRLFKEFGIELVFVAELSEQDHKDLSSIAAC